MNFCKYTIILILVLSNSVFSQEKVFKTKIEVASSYSFSGVNGMIGMSKIKSLNEFGLGIRTSISYLSRYQQSQFVGGYGEYNKYITIDKKFNSFLNVHYANLFRKIKSPISEKKSLFQIHEMYFGYGLTYQIHKFYFSNTINYGLIYERQMNFYSNSNTIFFHFGPMLKLSVKYEL